MQNLRVELGARSYEIVIGSGTLDRLGESLPAFGLSPKLALVSNPTVYGLYGDHVIESIRRQGFDCLKVIIPDGEEYKSMASLQQIFDQLLAHKLDRTSALVALGGGVIGDITGFAASTYMRGIAYLQVPTTLLAQVDSSVGGKTGINHLLGKNMIGTFWQPGLVWIDLQTLSTLKRRERLAGLAEVIKYGVIHDRGLFDFLETEREHILRLEEDALAHIIRRSCEIKAEVVSQDEREAGLRAILNYGHTIGHGVETATHYKEFLHGEAVAVGMCLEARLSGLLNLIPREEVARITALIDAYGLPTHVPGHVSQETILSAMQLDKKAVAGELRFVLPEGIGSVNIHKGIDEKLLGELLSSGDLKKEH